MNPSVNAPVRSAESVLATNKVLRNTYMLLSMTLLWSAMMAGVSMMLQMPPATYLISMVLGLVIAFFVLPKNREYRCGVDNRIRIHWSARVRHRPDSEPVPCPFQWSSDYRDGPRRHRCHLPGSVRIRADHPKDFSFLGGFLMVGFLVVVGQLSSIFLWVSPLYN